MDASATEPLDQPRLADHALMFLTAVLDLDRETARELARSSAATDGSLAAVDDVIARAGERHELPVVMVASAFALQRRSAVHLASSR